MATEKVRGKLQRKAGNGKGFLVEGVDGWFNTSDAATPYLAKLDVGTEVEVDYFKKGVKKEVTKIVAIASASPVAKAEAPKEESPTGFKCAVCGKTMKDGRFKVCFMCNKQGKKAPTAATEPTAEVETISKTTYQGSGSRYGSAEDIAGKEVGCACGCAASILAGRQEQPELLLEHFRVLANGILEHLRALK